MTQPTVDYLAIVRSVLAEAVGIDEGEVSPEATILGDLGAESIDLLEVLFRVQRETGVKIQSSEIADLLQGGLSDAEFESLDGIVTTAGLDQIRTVLPQIEPAKLVGELAADDIMTLFTVRNLVDMVAARAAAHGD